MDSEYISINMRYFGQAFIYLLAGTTLFLLRGVFQIPVTSESISLIWLFGFVTSMIFGVTNIMVPSYARRIPFNVNTIKIEISLLNIAIILLGVAMNVYQLKILFAPAVLALLLSTVIHTYNLMTVGFRPRVGPEEKGITTTYSR